MRGTPPPWFRRRCLRGKMSLDSLRADIERLRKASTRKVSRIKSNYGALVSGTQFDPRRSPHIENRYNKRQLESYKSQLESFLSRKTQFVGGSGGTPITRQQWERYKDAENQYNARVQSNFAKVADIRFPGGGETVDSYMERRTPRHREMTNPAVNSPYQPVVRRPAGFESGTALGDMIDEMEARLSGEYDRKQLERGRDQFGKMADRLGDDSLRAAVNELSDEQWELLWYYTPFANDVSMHYEFQKVIFSGKDQAVHHKVVEDAKQEYQELIDWAKSAR